MRLRGITETYAAFFLTTIAGALTCLGIILFYTNISISEKLASVWLVVSLLSAAVFGVWYVLRQAEGIRHPMVGSIETSVVGVLLFIYTAFNHLVVDYYYCSAAMLAVGAVTWLICSRRLQ